MSPVNALGLLALASSVLAVPNAHNHQHLHNRAAGSQSHVSMPSCWSTCFNKYNIQSESGLCASSVGSSVKSCIDTSCQNTPGAVSQYNSWLSNYCGASSVAATGTGTGVPTTTPTTPQSYPTNTWPASVPWPTTGWPSGWTTSVCTETSTLVYRTTTKFSTYETTYTVTVVESATQTGGWGSAASATETGSWGSGAGATVTAGAWTSGAAECGVDVTVTTKVYETVTVTAAGWSGEGSWGSEDTPTSTVSATPVAANTPVGKEHPTAGVETSPASAIETTPASPIETAASTGSGGNALSLSLGLGSSTTGGATPTSTPTSTGGAGFSKRGLAYNVAADCSPLYGCSQVGWGYNWGSLPEGLDTSEVAYIPMLWSNGATFTSYWNENAETCLGQGAEYFFSFNEPDMVSQANMSPQEAADAWMQYMEPYAGKVKLVAPAVTNGVGPGLGLDWLSEFLELCSSCTIDAVNQHWYDSTGNDVQLFQQQVTNATTISGKPVFVTEFAGIGTDSEISSFMEQVLSWMDSESNVLGYSYYMVGDGYLNSGSALSPLGTTYCNAN